MDALTGLCSAGSHLCTLGESFVQSDKREIKVGNRTCAIVLGVALILWIHGFAGSVCKPAVGGCRESILLISAVTMSSFGQAWVRYLLLDPSLAFRLRIRATDQIELNGVSLATKVIFAYLQVGQSQTLKGACQVWGCNVTVEVLRLEDGKLLTSLKG